MIKKLNQRIFVLIMVSLSIIVIGTVIIFTLLNYNNTINTSTVMMDRFMGEEPKRNPEERDDTYKIKPEFNVDGLYNILIENGTIVQSSNSSNNMINEYALKIVNKNSEKGIIGIYIYRVKKINKNLTRVTLIENEDAILHIRIMLIFAVCISMIFVVVIYIIARKLSKVIVKPVEETFEKQKQFISDASHELKTPLAVIEANADVLENEVGNNKWIQYIQNETESMNTLINELLLLSKIENVDNIKEYTELNLSEEVQIILSMFESMAYEKQS